ncbi:GNAT family N-acetyltransferase [Paraflavitalea pollutisoli]|uniref:GNAT family N-acetyltransferase n=1 Tax=Paraflavitalea pollutisoli TaxID=3034143 RepID=UPI0023ED0365|nr:GNAT family N-acetyltransferase [Paraflavitalea sp. H1-2-19X]
MHNNSIQYYTRAQIDPVRWNRCIDAAPNGLVYATTLYLDHMAGQWDALVMGDYEVVMPLPWKRKFGIRYLHWVPFAQQLGVFGPASLSAIQVQAMLQAALHHFNYGELFFNYANQGIALADARTNLILDLAPAYDQLRAAYKNDLLKNLDKAGKFPLQYHQQVALPLVLRAFRDTYSEQIAVIKPEEYDRFERLCTDAWQQGLVITRGVKEADGDWLSTALLFQYKGRLYLLHSATVGAGRKVAANHFLLDQLIREFAGSATVLDFEGSDLPGVAHFYRNFGSVEEPYFVYRFNRLPGWIKWLKRFS